ncbi:MAG: DNA mismatch repair endonuclease MutL [Pseudomonadota bacterium]
MSLPVRQLPPEIINRIAAGEVIERPASVVKELVENAIDAGATHIEIVTSGGGISLIRVSDNGSGMGQEDLQLAIERHATSKLYSDDLLNISTLGFRGEALASIGSVARLSLQSKTKVHDGHKIDLDAGRKGALKPAALNAGTCIEVRDLFYATPARLKFLKSERAENTAITDVVKRLAMVHPNIAFQLTTGERVSLRLTADDLVTTEGWLNRVGQIMGEDFAENALPISAQRDDIEVKGFAGLPTYHKATPQMQFLFVNNRPVKDKLLAGALRAAFGDFIPQGRYPALCLFITTKAQNVDVNVHPAKAEVRFRDPGRVRGLIVGALREALQDAGHQATNTLTQDALHYAQSNTHPMPSAIHSSRAQSHYSSSPYSGFSEDNQTRLSGFHEPSGDSSANDTDQDQQALYLPLGAARAQLHQNYIISQTEEAILIIDQHAAHERIVYEKMKQQLEHGGVSRQMLLMPEVIDLTQKEAEAILERRQDLEDLGLVVEAFGENAVLVRETPSLLGQADVQGVVKDLAEHIAAFDDVSSLKEKLEHICATLACYGSVRSGRKLNGQEMNALLRDMEATPHSGQCNHGRPTYVTLKLTDIEKLFHRR